MRLKHIYIRIQDMNPGLSSIALYPLTVYIGEHVVSLVFMDLLSINLIEPLWPYSFVNHLA